jgi:basic amino acid/polyamine antiporter, APA family
MDWEREGPSLRSLRLPAVLSPLQALGVIVGGTIGASIFLVPSVIAQRVPYLAGALAIWVVGAAITFTSVLTISELAAMLPDAGGGYAYIRAALGSAFGFLFAWTDAFLIRAGAAAAVGFTFGIYFAQIVAPPAGLALPLWEGGAAIVLIVILSLLNSLGARAGAGVQVAGMAMKTLALSSALVLPLLLWHGPNNLKAAPFFPPAGVALSTGILFAMTPVMWTYGGWEQLAHLAEEIREPGKNLPRIFAAGLAMIAVLFLAVAVGIHYVLPYSAVAKSEAVGADLFKALFGPAGAQLISVVILLSAVVTANGAILAGSRAAFAVARDGDAPQWLGRVNRRFQAPANGVMAVGGWAIVLIGLSVAAIAFPAPAGWPLFVRDAWVALQHRPLFDILISYVMFGYLLLQALVALSLIMLRRAHPEWRRPFRVPGYPFTPLASVAATAFLMFAVAQSNTVEVFAGLCLILAGLPVWWIYNRRYHR